MTNILAWLNNNLGLITAIVGFITIIAIFRSPITALRIQKKIEDHREKTSRKLNIFKTLLATRGNTTSLKHVQALNMIDIEFFDNKDVRASWNIYRDHLNSFPKEQDKSAIDRWCEKQIDYLTDLLYSMSQYFGYDFDKVILKKGAYSPVAHGILEQELTLLRRGLVEIVSGRSSFPIKINLEQEGASKNQL